MLSGSYAAGGLELKADAAGVRDLVTALCGEPGSFCQINLAAHNGVRLASIRIKGQAGQASVHIVRIGDILDINGSAAKVREVAASRKSLPARFAGHAAADGGADPLVVLPA